MFTLIPRALGLSVMPLIQFSNKESFKYNIIKPSKDPSAVFLCLICNEDRSLSDFLFEHFNIKKQFLLRLMLLEVKHIQLVEDRSRFCNYAFRAEIYSQAHYYKTFQKLNHQLRECIRNEYLKMIKHLTLSTTKYLLLVRCLAANAVF